MIRDGANYFIDPFNYADITLIFLNIYLIEEALNGANTEDEVANKVRPIASIVVLLSWLKSFYWLKLFGETSFYVRLVIWALYDIRHFMVLFVMILMTFGNTIMILSQGRDENLYREYTNNSFINVMMNQYELSLGNTETDNFESQDFAWIMFLLSTILTQILFLNMIIAIMSDTYAKVTESKEQSALVEKMNIMADYVYVVPRETKKRKTKTRFLF